MPISIKRYPNRKLYDTQSRRYITLAQLATMLRQGDEIQVVDYATGEDLTALTLSQIISEQERRSGGFLPRPVLAGLVQAGGATLDVMRQALNSPLDLLRNVDDEIQRRLEALVAQGELSEAEGAHLLEKLLSVGRRLPPASLDVEQTVRRVMDARGVPTRSDLQKLIDQMEALSRQLDRLG